MFLLYKLANQLQNHLKDARRNYFKGFKDAARRDIELAKPLADAITYKLHDNLLSFMVRDMFAGDLEADYRHEFKLSVTLSDIKNVTAFIEFKKDDYEKGLC